MMRLCFNIRNYTTEELLARKWFCVPPMLTSSRSSKDTESFLMVGLKASNRDVSGFNAIAYAKADNEAELVAHAAVMGIELQDCNAHSAWMNKMKDLVMTIKCTNKAARTLNGNYTFCDWHLERWEDLGIWVVAGKRKDKLATEETAPVCIFFSDSKEEAKMQCALRGIELDEHQ